MNTDRSSTLTCESETNQNNDTASETNQNNDTENDSKEKSTVENASYDVNVVHNKDKTEYDQDPACEKRKEGGENKEPVAKKQKGGGGLEDYTFMKKMRLRKDSNPFIVQTVSHTKMIFYEKLNKMVDALNKTSPASLTFSIVEPKDHDKFRVKYNFDDYETDDDDENCDMCDIDERQHITLKDSLWSLEKLEVKVKLERVFPMKEREALLIMLIMTIKAIRART